MKRIDIAPTSDGARGDRRRLSTITLVCSVLALIVALASWLSPGRGLKVGYVRSGELIYSYTGMKEAQTLYKEREAAWQAEIDTLRTDFQKALHAYNLEGSALSTTQRNEREAFLAKQEENVRSYTERVARKAREEETRMTQGVLNQVNTVAEEYGREHGFDIILGTTQSGNILYGAEAIDITDDLLKILNESYGETASIDTSHAMQ